MDERVLDATLRLLGEYGDRKISMDDIAATAKVARATLFRRFGSKEALIQRTYDRELRRVLVQFHADTDHAEDPLVAGFVSLTTAACTHPVSVRMARVEPEVLIGFWRDPPLPGIELIHALLNSVAGDRHVKLVDGLARLMLSFMLIPDGRPSETEVAAVVRRLETMEWDGMPQRVPGATVGAR